MGDYAFIYDEDEGYCDMKIVGGDFLLCDTPTVETEDYANSEIPKTYNISSLEVAVLIALFTDRRANTDEIRAFQAGQVDRQSRRGYWANTYKDYVQGSGLWLLSRAKKTAKTLSDAETYMSDALEHLLTEGVVAEVTPSASFDGEELVLAVQITKPDGQGLDFKYQFAWDSFKVL